MNPTDLTAGALAVRSPATGAAIFRRVFATIACTVLAVACEDSTDPGPDSGTVRLQINVQGGQFAPGAQYFISVDGQEPVAFAASATFEVGGVASGTRQVSLGELPENCFASVKTRSIEVKRGQVVVASFLIVCQARNGSLTIVTSISGSDRDIDGYRILVDGLDYGEIGTNAASLQLSVLEGEHRIKLKDVARNCSGGGEVVRQVNFKQAVQLDFAVNCVPSSATVQVTVATTGIERPNGYTLALPGSTVQMPVNGNTTLTDLPEDDVGIKLVVPVNCVIAGDALRMVAPQSEQQLEVQFTVACSSPNNAIRVDVVTTGTDIDVDGYQVVMDQTYYYGAAFAANVSPNGSVIIDQLIPASQHFISISGLAANCEGGNATFRVVQVAANTTTVITFNIHCRPTGKVNVTVRTTGAGTDPDGFRVQLQGLEFRTIPANTPVEFPLVPNGSWVINLSGLSSNCTIVGNNSVSVNVTAGNTVNVVFDVHCLSAPAVLVSITTGGAPVDPDGYLVRLIAPGIDVTVRVTETLHQFSELPFAGQFQVHLLDVAPNCIVNPPGNIRIVTVFPGDVGTVSFAVTCGSG